MLTQAELVKPRSLPNKPQWVSLVLLALSSLLWEVEGGVSDAVRARCARGAGTGVVP